MDIVSQLDKLIENRVNKINVVYTDGAQGTIRIFKHRNTGRVCEYRKHSRKYGYFLDIEKIKEIQVPSKKMTEEQKWIRSWKKVKAQLQEHGLWGNIVEEIDHALELGYTKIRELNNHYWGEHYDDLAFFKEHAPTIIVTRDDGTEYIKSSMLHFYSNIPKVKKMRFSKYGITNQHHLDQIKSHMDKKQKYSCYDRYNYDISFEYNPEKMKAWYSEEFKGCGNGHYYLAISPTHAMFCEDD